MNGLINFNEWRKQAEAYKRAVKQVAQQNIEEAAGYAETMAKGSAPVQYGFHRQNIKGSVENAGYTARLTANATYAPYLEFGTGGGVDVPRGFETMAKQLKGRGIRQVNLPARPHIIPAAYSALDFLTRNIEADLDKL
jgi:hypothetical protein